ncbi:MAG: class I SAM-dependent methyltransferase [Rhizobiaceae bacterium]
MSGTHEKDAADAKAVIADKKAQSTSATAAATKRVRVPTKSGAAKAAKASMKGKQAKESVFPVPERTHAGLHYLDVIGRIDAVLKPSTYLEIGTHDGSSLRRVSCASIAVDPNFVIDSNVIGTKPKCFAFQMTSDRFFELHDPKQLLGGPVKLAFLDGMHRFEFLLRDFIQVEKHCEPNSLVLLHDCFPLNVAMTERIYNVHARPGFDLIKSKDDFKQPAFWWTGDVWKVLWILKKFRPELVMLNLDAAPTGLTMLTGLNPASTVLEDKYFQIVHEFGNLSMSEDRLKEHFEKFPLLSANNVSTETQLSRCFWL